VSYELDDGSDELDVSYELDELDDESDELDEPVELVELDTCCCQSLSRSRRSRSRRLRSDSSHAACS
jgi:hypothetical protein